MSEPVVILGFLIYGAVCYGIGYFVGNKSGVEETELRWSEAVQRADWHRRFG